MKKKQIIVITYGTFDLLHIGHINILKRAKELGDILIVGITAENYDRSRGKLNVVKSLEERMKDVKKLGLADKIIVEKHFGQKIEDIKKYKVDTFVIGDDWKGKFDYLKSYCKIIYLPRTKGISSTLLRHKVSHIRLGVIGLGNIARRFIDDIKSMDSIKVASILSKDIHKVEKYIKENNILYGFGEKGIDNFFNSPIDAVYIATPHELHYRYAKRSLNEGKHTLVEKPIVLNKKHLKNLIKLSKKNKLVLMEAIKTAYLPGTERLVREINRGAIGEIRGVRATFTKLVMAKNVREWQSEYGGSTTELISYPMFLAVKILGSIKQWKFYPQFNKEKKDISNLVVSEHQRYNFASSFVGLGVKSEGDAVIKGTNGYAYIPAPWWLMERFHIRYENSNEEKVFTYKNSAGIFQYEAAEFVNLIRRKSIESKKLLFSEISEINKVISDWSVNNIKIKDK